MAAEAFQAQCRSTAMSCQAKPDPIKLCYGMSVVPTPGKGQPLAPNLKCNCSAPLWRTQLYDSTSEELSGLKDLHLREHFLMPSETYFKRLKVSRNFQEVKSSKQTLAKQSNTKQTEFLWAGCCNYRVIMELSSHSRKPA